MLFKIKFSDLVAHYHQNKSEFFICWHITKITNLATPIKPSDMVCIEDAVKRFFAQYFQLVDGSCSTIGYWFCQYDDENLWKSKSCYVMTNKGEKLIHNDSGRSLRIMLMEYILRVDPEAVFSFEINKG